MTRAAMKVLIANRKAVAKDVPLFCLRASQAVRYLEIMEGNPNQENLGWGWVHGRAFEV